MTQLFHKKIEDSWRKSYVEHELAVKQDSFSMNSDIIVHKSCIILLAVLRSILTIFDV
ncbi:MAG: hypothetical protein LBJ45_01865 [Holosporaceae bacterium]|jgi:hypothetical protein|nr:hypothetical protein [Holosporaceae bacterium]